MVKYTYQPKSVGDKEKTAIAKGDNVRVHFKNVVEVASAVKGKMLARAKQYLENVLEHKEAIACQNSKGGRGRHAQAKNTNATGSQAFWPKNATTQVLQLLKNAEANATFKGLKVEKLYVKHISCNMAPKGRRRTYRAHGRIGPYMSTPSHIEIVLAEQHESVKKEVDETLPKIHKIKFAKRYLRVPEGAATA